MSQLDELLEEAQEEEKKELKAVGIDKPYNDWRESMPNERIPDEAALDTFMHLTDLESAAQKGQLEVLIGGQPLGDIATTPPGRGPDDEEGSPDEAGDTPDEGGLTPVPGMWIPPQESEAENYKEPTVEEIKADPEFIKNAKIFHERLGTNRSAKTDEEIADWAADQMSLFNWNTIGTLSYAQAVMKADDPEFALAFLNVMNMYDHSDGGAKEFGKALVNMGTDPITYFGAGVGGFAARGAAKATAKSGLKKAIQLALIGGTAGASEGSALAGGFELARQNIEQEAGARKDLDYGQVGLQAAAGGGLGLLLGGGGGALAGRYLDKLLAGADAELTRQLGGRKRRVSDLTEEQLRTSLEASARASAEAGKRDPMTEMLLKGLEGDDLPRTDKGDLDIDKFIDTMLENYNPDMPLRQTIDIETGKQITVEGYPGPNMEPVAAVEAGVKWWNSRWMETDYMNTDPAEGITITDDGITWPDYWFDGPEDMAEIIEAAKKSNAQVLAPEEYHDITKRDVGTTLMHSGSDNVEIRGSKEQIADFFQHYWDVTEKNAAMASEGHRELYRKIYGAYPDDPIPDNVVDLKPVPMTESDKLKQRILEMDELQKGELVLRSPTSRGSTVRSLKDSGMYELHARTKNGWYKGINRQTGEEANFRRKDFDIVDKAPAPHHAGPLSLDPFSPEAAKVIKMAEDVSGRKLKDQVIPISKHRELIEDMKSMGIDILKKDEMSYWTPAELMWLRDTYNAQSEGMAELVRRMESKMRNEGGLTDADLALFNQAHTQFMATRDLFYGTSGNAARQLNILKTRPTKEIYDFADAIRNDVGVGGGRVNTERTIMNFFEAMHNPDATLSAGQKIAKANQTIWDQRVASAILITRYNLMLMSWRTHFFNFLGNSVSGLYQHLLISPIGGAINNVAYASQLALSKIPGVKVTPDAGGRYTAKVWRKEGLAHFHSALDSLKLAKEIALGRDIGEGKIWNELGLRYDVVNVPNSAFGKIGTTPVRMLEAGDAFFKAQYYNSHMYGTAARRARRAEVEDGVDFETAFQQALDEAKPQDIQAAKDYAAKMTYTNDPNVYQNIFGVLADGLNRIQSRDKSLTMNLLMPFIRTPANLISYSVEMTGLNAIIPGFGMGKFYSDLTGKNPAARHEALAKLTAAIGLWYTVQQLHAEGRISGTGPVNWEEVEAWKAAGWQPNSVKLGDKWYDTARAAPGGRALNIVASIMDYMALNHEAQEEDQIGWVGAGLLYLADNMIDESFMSTTADFITAVQAKNTGRSQSIAASTINSMVIPNLVRDLRRVTDPTVRSTTSPDIGTQIVNQMRNAWPGFSDALPPRRDWKGDPINYYGNAYYRGLVPFSVRDSQETDVASMAIAYHRIGPSKPDKRIALPGGFVDLFAMDEGRGFVYDKYVEFMGKARHEAVTRAMGKSGWERAVAEGSIGPGSDGDRILRKALSVGSSNGRLMMLQWLQDHSGDNNTFKRANGDTVMIHHQFDKQQYKEIARQVIKGMKAPEDTPQYDMKEKQEGPHFFEPRGDNQ